jgi:hypothetical protein
MTSPFEAEGSGADARTAGWRSSGGGGISFQAIALYFSSNAITRPLLILSAWAVGGVIVTMIVSVLASVRRQQIQPQQAKPATAEL